MEILIAKVSLFPKKEFDLPDFDDKLSVQYYIDNDIVNISSVKLSSGLEFIHFLLQDEFRYIKEQCKKIYLASKL